MKRSARGEPVIHEAVEEPIMVAGDKPFTFVLIGQHLQVVMAALHKALLPFEITAPVINTLMDQTKSQVSGTKPG